jgi:hypothetical protein
MNTQTLLFKKGKAYYFFIIFFIVITLIYIYSMSTLLLLFSRRDLPTSMAPVYIASPMAAHFTSLMLTFNTVSILLCVKPDPCTAPFNRAVLERENYLYFNCHNLGEGELSQSGILYCYLNAIFRDFGCKTEPVTFGAP